MKILTVGINFWPEETGIAVYSTGRSEYLASRGHEMTFCTAFPYYPHWRIAEAYRGALYRNELRNGVMLRRSFLYVPRKVTALKRILHELSFALSAVLSSLFAPRPDVAIVVSPPLALGFLIALLSRLRGIPCVVHVPDLQPDAALDLGMLRAPFLAKALYALERGMYRLATCVSTLSEGMRDRIVTKGVDETRVLLWRDWAESDLFDIETGAGAEAFRRKWGLEGRFLVVHAGNMGVKQGLTVVLDAAERSRDDGNLVYLLVGDGAVRRPLEAEAAKRGLQNVRFLPLLPREEFVQLLEASDVCLVTQQKAVGDIVFPSKVRTLLAAGKPVVASVTASSEIARVLEEAGGGVVVEPESASELVDALVSLRADPAKLGEMARSGRQYAERHWAKDGILAEVEAALERIVPGSGSVTLARVDAES